ncbi:unnamed protein product [Dovyalis caffra]|uniref:Uncharacterized protein n=1 Tax=Dovyalis caffra TaxID=77055 RepID=A0AAV1RU50_9ROSI|nr:unnamed protein product [Dovyalis caffra]
MLQLEEVTTHTDKDKLEVDTLIAEKPKSSYKAMKISRIVLPVTHLKTLHHHALKANANWDPSIHWIIKEKCDLSQLRSRFNQLTTLVNPGRRPGWSTIATKISERDNFKQEENIFCHKAERHGVSYNVG